jgi:predicted membrane metal-binding protein
MLEKSDDQVEGWKGIGQRGTGRSLAKEETKKALHDSLLTHVLFALAMPVSFVSPFFLLFFLCQFHVKVLCRGSRHVVRLLPLYHTSSR